MYFLSPKSFWLCHRYLWGPDAFLFDVSAEELSHRFSGAKAILAKRIELIKNGEYAGHSSAAMPELLQRRSAYHGRNFVLERPGGTPVTLWNFGTAFKDLAARAEVTSITSHDLPDGHASL